MHQYTIRGDHRISDRDSLSARYTDFLNYTNNGNNGPYVNPAVRYRYDFFHTHNAVVSETHTFSPSFLNEFRLGVGRQYFPFTEASYNGGWPQKLGFPTDVPSTVVPTISNGYAAFNTGTVGFRGALSWNATDALTLVRGRHTLKLGAQYRLLFGNNYQTSNPSGTFNFSAGLTGNPQGQSGTGSTYADFLTGYVSSASISTYLGESEKGYSLSGFVQDDWRALPRLSVNLGLRYDYQQPPFERNCGTSNFNPTGVLSNGLHGTFAFACANYGKTFLNPDYKDFAPRVGFAYDVTGSGKTVIRGGYSMFYPSIFNLLYFGNTTGFATTGTSYISPGNNSNLPAFILSQAFPTPFLQPLGKALAPAPIWDRAFPMTSRARRRRYHSNGTFPSRSSYPEIGWSK